MKCFLLLREVVFFADEANGKEDNYKKRLTVFLYRIDIPFLKFYKTDRD